MTEADNQHRQDSPEEPPHPKEAQSQHSHKGDAGDDVMIAPEEGIGDMSPVQLTDGDEVDGGDPQTDPGGVSHRMELEPLFRREHPVNGISCQLEEYPPTKKGPNLFSHHLG